MALTNTGYLTARDHDKEARTAGTEVGRDKETKGGTEWNYLGQWIGDMTYLITIRVYKRSLTEDWKIW